MEVESEHIDSKLVACHAGGFWKNQKGAGHTVFIDDKQRAWSVGWNKYGQLGRMTAGMEHTDFMKTESLEINSSAGADEAHAEQRTLGLVAGIQGCVGASCGQSHTCFLMSNGDILAAGQEGHGQLGFRKDPRKLDAAKIPIPGKMRDVVAGANHTLAVADSGEVYVFGDFSSTSDHSKPTALFGNTFETPSRSDPYALVKNGKGFLKSLSGETYDGDWCESMREGTGTGTWTDGMKYSGKWHQNMRHGKGELHLPSGDEYKGDFVEV